MALILVVDSNTSDRERIATRLRELGHDVSESESAESALRVLQTLRGQVQDTTNPGIVSAGGITIDSVGHRVMVNGDYLSFAPREYRLLLFLLTNQDRVFSRKQLLVHVWDRDSMVGGHPRRR